MKKRRDRTVSPDSRRQARVEVLEPRVLFSADIVPGLAAGVDVTRELDDQTDPLATSTLPIVKESAVTTPLRITLGEDALPVSEHAENIESLLVPEPNPDAPASPPPASLSIDSGVTSNNNNATQGVDVSDQPVTPVPEQSATNLEVVFIDSRVEEYQLLVEDLQRHDPEVRFAVVLVDQTEDGLHKVSDSLEELGTVTAIHVISHGSDGNIQLGATKINDALLDVRGDELVDWSDNLSAGADILIYGCDLAATQNGITLINQLAELCQCDVAASEDKTGSAVVGADWDLEYVTGIVQTDIAISKAVQQSWQHQLDITSNLVAHYEFEEGAGSSAADSTGNNDGVVPFTVWSTDSARGNYALDFSGDPAGANSWFYANDHTTLDFGSSDFTVSFWMKSAAVPAFGSDVVGQSSGGPDGFRFFTDNLGDVNFGVNGSFTYVENVHDNNWHLITGVKTAGTLTMYHNGAFERSGSTSGGVGGSVDFRVGATGANADDYEGLIDDVRIYNRALSPTDVSELFSASPGNSAPQLSSLDNNPVFTEGSSAVIIDPSVQVADAELDALNSGLGNYSGASLNLARIGTENTDDVFSFTSGNGLSVFGTELRKSGVNIGSLDLVPGHISVTFTDANGGIPTTADVENFIQQVSYQNTSDAPPGDVDLQWTLSDGNAGGQGSGGPLSTSGLITVDINAVNDAPDYDTFGDSFLQPVLENSTGSEGNSVTEIVASAGGDRITDVDGTPPEGIAVVGTNGSGTWQYSIDAGATWFNIGAASVSNALLLDAADRIRFEPATGFTGTAFLAIGAWDQSSGVAGTYADATSRGGSTPFSTQFEAAGIEVIQVAEVTISPLTAEINEDSDLFFSGINAITVDDGTSADTRLRVSLDVANGKIKLPTVTTGLTYISGTFNSESMVIEGTESDINAAFSGMRYQPDNNYNGSETLQITATLADSVGRYPFDSSAIDVSDATGNDGTLRNSAAIVVDTERGQVLELKNALLQDVRIPGAFGFPSSITAAAWVNPASAYSEVLSIGGGVFDIRIDDPNEGGKVVAFYYDGLQYHSAVSTQAIANTGWHHVAASFDNVTKKITLYIDGVEAASTIGGNSIAYSGNSYIGSNTGGSLHYEGRIDEVRVFDRALTAEEIAGLAADASDASQSIPINVLPVNDSPNLRNLHGDKIQITNDGISRTLDAAIVASIRDVDNTDFDTGFIRVAGTGFDSLDQLDIVTGDVSLSSGMTNGSAVTVSGVAVGTLSGVTGSTLQVDFNASATKADIEVLLGAFAVNSTSTVYGDRSITVVLNDGDGGADSSQVDVVVVSATPGTITVAEDTNYLFSAADFYIAGAVGPDLKEITITALPSTGTLTLNTIPVTTNQIISKASIDAGELTYTPPANSHGNAISDLHFYANSGSHTITVLPGEPNNYTVGASGFSETNQIVDSTSNFSKTGTVPVRLLTAGQDSSVDADYLAGGDILFSGFVSDAQVDPAELAAIDLWVNNGGVLIATSDSSAYDPVSSYYGLPVTGAGNSDWSIVNASHPVIDGPFGLVGAIDDLIYGAGTIGNYSRTDLLPGDIELAKDSLSGEPTVVVRQIGNGWVLFIADEGVFGESMTGGGIVSTPNDKFSANVFAWAAGVTPDNYQLNFNVDAVNDAPTFTSVPLHQVTPETLSISQPSFTAFADLDGDGNDDLVSIDSATGEVVYFQGDGNGEYSTKTIAAGGFIEPGEVTAADLDGDGDVDLVVADYNTVQSSLVVLENNGAGVFTSSILEPLSDGVVQVDSEDLDNDGDIDIVANYWFSGELVWYENQGAGVFARNVVDTQAGGTSVDAVDVNGDGAVDLVASFRNSHSVIYYENNGSAGFVSQQYTVSNAYDVAVADLDGDGNRDIAYVGLSGVTGWLRNNGSASPSFSDISLANTGRTVQITAADIDGDGDNDLLTTRDTADEYGLYENDGTGAFGQSVFATGSTPAHITAIDVDADGDLEIITTDKGSTDIRIFDNQGGGEFTRYSTLEDTPITISGIVIDDTDVLAASLQMDVLVTGGTVNLSSVNGLSFTQGDGFEDNNLVFTGNLSDINSAIANLLFQPQQNFSGIASIQLTVNDLGNTGAGGAKQALENIYIDVEPVNDAPVLSGLEAGVLTYTENDSPTPVSSTIQVDDVDHVFLESATVTISNNYATGDILAFSNFSNITGVWDAPTATLTLSGTDTVANYQTALRSVAYESSSEMPSVLQRTVSYVVSDGSEDSTAQVRYIDVLSINDEPVLSGIDLLEYDYTENDGAVVITSSLTISDADDTLLESALVIITPATYVQGESVLSFTDTPNINGVWDENNGRLLLTGTDTVSNYQAALRSVTYENILEDPLPGTLNLEFHVNDGDADSNAVTRAVNISAINDAPVISGIETSAVNYIEDGSSQPLTGTAILQDVDNNTLQGAVIQLDSDYVIGEDILSFVDTAMISSVWDPATGSLVLSGADNIANYEAAIRAVSYHNTSQNPTVLSRNVSITVDDGDALSSPVLRKIIIQPVNDPPVVSGVETPALDYTEADGSVGVTSSLAVSDVDNINIEGATVAIADNYQSAEESLLFTDTATITGSWDPFSGELTLSGTDTLANYETALRNVAYENTSVTPSELVRRVDFSVFDGTASSLIDSRGINVISLNSAPAVSAVESATLQYNENSAAVSASASITLTDTDDLNLDSAQISIVSNYNASEDVLSFTDTANISHQWDAVSGTLTLTGTDTVAAYQSALRSVQYENLSDNPSSALRAVAYTVFDGEKYSNIESRNLSVRIINDAPVVTSVELTDLAYVEDAGPVPVSDTITLTDADDINLDTAVIRFSANYSPGQDVLAFSDTASITGSWDAASGSMTLTGVDTVAGYQAALRTVTYENLSDAPATQTRTVEFLVNDSALDSNTQGRKITVARVNDGPQLSSVEPVSLAYTENDGEVALTTSIFPTDVDGGNLQSARVSIVAGYEVGQDILHYNGPASIVGTWNTATGSLELAGSASAAEYELAMRSISYENTSENPATAARTVEFRINDGFVDSNVLSRVVDVTAINDAPVINSIETGPLNYLENSGAVPITPALIITDVDDSHLETATISIDSGYVVGEDQLLFTNTTSINGSWNALTGTLTLTGTDTVANYQLALRSVMYTNNSDDPSSAQRSVSFRLNDGGLDSGIQNRTIDITPVNDAPAIGSLESLPLVYIENSGAVTVSNAVTITDADHSALASASVSIDSGYISNEDMLSFTDTATITGSWDAVTGVLTLSGNDTVANYQSALRSVSYENTLDNPSTGQRVVSFTVSDGTDASVLQNRDIQIVPVNDPPLTASIEPDALAYTENDGPVVVTSTLTITDVDDSFLDFAVIQIDSGYVSGEDQLVFANTATLSGSWDASTGTLTIVGTDSVENYQAALRNVAYQNTGDSPSGVNRTVVYTVSDGEFNSVTLDRQINLLPVNDAPVISSIENVPVNIVENSLPVAVSTELVLTDDNSNLLSATVSISGNYISGEDILAYSGSTSLVSSWDATTGVLTLTGSDTVAVYQSALRQITYQNLSDSPSTLPKVISYSVNDGELSSSAQQRVLNMLPENDMPAVASVEITPLGYQENSAATITSSVTLSDIDNDSLQQATLWVSGNFIASEDYLRFVDTATISSSWDETNGTLILSGSDTVANYQAAIRAVVYENLSESPSVLPRTVSISVNDGLADSNLQARDILVESINDAPVLNSIEVEPFNYSEGEPSVSVTDQLVVVDADNTLIQRATISISGNYVAGEEALEFTDTPEISGIWNPVTGEMILTGVATVESYQYALRSVSYINTSENPSTALRTVSITVADFALESGAISRELNIEAVNDAPVQLGLESGIALYTEGDARVQITNEISLSDQDNTELTFATVRIVENFHPLEDVLTYNGPSTITASWNAASGVLSLSGIESVANYQAALRSVFYENISENPSALLRRVEFTVTDGQTNAADITRDIQVRPENDPPELTADSLAPVTYIENSQAQAVFQTVTLTDPDNTVLQSARVGFVSGYVEGEDHLQLSGTTLITADWDPITGVLQLTGPGSVADYQTLIRSLAYYNSSENPDTSGRVVDLAVNDGVSDSNLLQKSVEVIAVNDAPAGTNITLSIDEDISFVFSASDFGFSDVAENHAFSSVKITADPVEGQLLLNNQIIVAGQSVNISEINAGSLVYLPPLNVNGQNADTFFFQVQDNGGSESGGVNTDTVARQMIIDIEAVNDAPSGADTSLSGVEDIPVVIGITDLGFSDPADQHSIDSIIINSVPVQGGLYLNGTPLQQNSVIAANDIAAGGFSYLPEPDESGDAYTSFEFTVIDNGGISNGGNNTAQATNTVVINVSAVNDSPIIVTRTLTLPEGSEQLINTDLLNGIDVDNLQPVELTFTVTNTPQHGELLLAGNSLGQQQSFSLADIINGNVSYRHDGSETSADAVTFSLVDSENDSINPALGTLAIIVQEVLDSAPVIDNDTLQLSFGQSFDSSEGDLLDSGLSTVGGSVLQGDRTGLTLSLEQGPRHGTFDFFADGTFAYVHNGSDILIDEFSYRITNEDGIYTVATVEILIEPPIASAFAPFAPEAVIEFVTAETVEAEIEENLIEQASDIEEPSVDLTDSIAYSLSPFETDTESEQTEDTRPVVTLDSVQVDNSDLILFSEALEVKQHNQSVAAVAFDSASARIIESLEFEISSGDSRYGISNPPFLEGLLRLESDLGDAASDADKRIQLANEAVFGITISATAGVVAWIIRGGALFASVMAVTPLWSSIDPGKLLKGDKEEPEDQMSEEVEQYFETG